MIFSTANAPIIIPTEDKFNFAIGVLFQYLNICSIFGQISRIFSFFLFTWDGFLIRNDYTTILNHKPLFLNASRPSKILRSYTPTFLSNFITIATLTQICNTRLRIRKNANIKKNKKILNKSIGQMSFRKEKILFLILLFYFFRFLVRQEKWKRK